MAHKPCDEGVQWLAWSWDDLLKAVVVIAGIKARVGDLNLQATTDNAAGTSVSGTWRAHRVLTVIATRLARQYPLTVAENGAILVTGKRATLQNA